MADYVLSNRADDDLSEMYAYSYREFGEDQADSYFARISTCLNTLAASPHLGRPAEDLHPGLHRHTCAAHAIFYILTDTGIFVARILHQSMDTPRHF